MTAFCALARVRAGPPCISPLGTQARPQALLDDVQQHRVNRRTLSTMTGVVRPEPVAATDASSARIAASQHRAAANMSNEWQVKALTPRATRACTIVLLEGTLTDQSTGELCVAARGEVVIDV